MDLILYQTLEDRNNYDHVSKNGPFECRRNNAWLGKGYYFWDGNIQLAHWWGKTAYSTYSSYYIARAVAYLDSTCWDLHGNMHHLQELKEIKEEMVAYGYKQKELLVPMIIEYFVKYNEFAYSSIRALPMKSIGGNNFEAKSVRFVTNNPAFLDLNPPIQVCLLSKNALNLHDFQIVYPKTEEDEFI